MLLKWNLCSTRRNVGASPPVLFDSEYGKVPPLMEVTMSVKCCVFLIYLTITVAKKKMKGKENKSGAIFICRDVVMTALTVSDGI